MNVINYDREMRKVIEGLTDKPRLFLHSCCAPCSTRCIEELYPHFRLTVVYYNPNIDTEEEYVKRAEEQRRYLVDRYGDTVEMIEDGYHGEDYEEKIKGYESCPEGGDRCGICFRLRLERVAKLCGEDDYFATTLTVSPLKNAERINSIGEEVAQKYGIRYLNTDFKKREGYKRSIVLSEEYGLYRQDYCGCKYSKRK